MSLNILPDGSPSPQYTITAVTAYGEEETVILTEWWYDYKKVESIEKSALNYFYDVFDKRYFKITYMEELERNKNEKL